MRWKALLMAVPASGVAIVLIELTRLPLELPSHSLAAFALLGRSAVSAFFVPAVLAGLPRVFDADEDPGQRRDLREQDRARFERMLPFVDRYRRARDEGRRFRFAPEDRR